MAASHAFWPTSRASEFPDAAVCDSPCAVASSGAESSNARVRERAAPPGRRCELRRRARAGAFGALGAARGRRGGVRGGERGGERVRGAIRSAIQSAQILTPKWRIFYSTFYLSSFILQPPRTVYSTFTFSSFVLQPRTVYSTFTFSSFILQPRTVYSTFTFSSFIFQPRIP